HDMWHVLLPRFDSTLNDSVPLHHRHKPNGFLSILMVHMALGSSNKLRASYRQQKDLTAKQPE
ncbi:MAG: hypothetical protein ACK5DV_00385, partial [Planctomycetota bacterium]